MAELRVIEMPMLIPFYLLLVALVILVLNFICARKTSTKLMLLNSTGTVVVLLTILLGEITGTTNFLIDVALVYVSTSFIAGIALLKFTTAKKNHE